MRKILLDASALLALVKQEQGAEHVSAEIEYAAISIVNITKIVTNFFDAGMSEEAIQKALTPLNLFDEDVFCRAP